MAGEPTGFIVSREDPIDGYSPTRDGRFRIGFLAAPEDLGMIGTLLAIGANQFGSGVDIPHDHRPGFEIIRTFRGTSLLCRLAVVVFAANLHREDGWTFDESHLIGRERPQVIGRIRREGFTA